MTFRTAKRIRVVARILGGRRNVSGPTQRMGCCMESGQDDDILNDRGAGWTLALAALASFTVALMRW
jgi:hypothetical protein